MPVSQRWLQERACPADLGRCQGVLGRTMDPPAAAAVDAALRRLQQVGALDEAEGLTALGSHLAHMPLDPGVGKMLILGAALRCVEPVLPYAAVMGTTRSVFATRFDDLEWNQRKKAFRKKLADGVMSDHDVEAQLLRQWDKKVRTQGPFAAQTWARSNFMIPSALRLASMLRRQCGRVRTRQRCDSASATPCWHRRC